MHYRLRLLGGFELRDDSAAITLPPSTQRVIAYLGLHDHPVSRVSVAGNLWLDSPDRQALANLRSSIWRLRQAATDLVRANGEQLGLDDGVRVDVREVTEHARAVIDGAVPSLGGALTDIESAAVLLPDWYEDWALLERERFRQLRLHAMESLCVQLTYARRYARAAEVGLLVVGDEPLRESAHRALMQVHLAEGNLGEALRQYAAYERVMREDLGLGPSRQMLDLVATVRSNAREATDGDDMVTVEDDTRAAWHDPSSQSPTPSSERELLRSARTR